MKRAPIPDGVMVALVACPLGRPWAVTGLDARGFESSCLHTTSGEHAYAIWLELPERTRGSIYNRTRAKWKRITPSQASVSP